MESQFDTHIVVSLVLSYDYLCNLCNLVAFVAMPILVENHDTAIVNVIKLLATQDKDSQSDVSTYELSKETLTRPKPPGLFWSTGLPKQHIGLIDV